MKVEIYILCGGSGLRLWPVSRADFPKQFASIQGEGASLLSATLKRAARLSSNVSCITADQHKFLVQEELTTQGLMSDILVEPVGKNTAAAVAFASLRADPESLLVFMPADLYIPDEDALSEAILTAADFAREQGSLVVLGVKPTSPSTAYGYVRRQTNGMVNSFHEKPNLSDAIRYVGSGEFLWNSGIFIGQARTFAGELQAVAGDIYDVVRESLSENVLENTQGPRFVYPNAEVFLQVREVSFDKAVLEKVSNLFCVEFRSQWSDLGSWSSVADVLSPNLADKSGSVVIGGAVVANCTNVFVKSSNRKFIVAGVQDCIIVDTPDATLVCSKGEDQAVKGLFSAMPPSELERFLSSERVVRPWGWYETIDKGERFKVKKISVKPGASLSSQLHHHRAEHWVVVKGTALVTKEHETQLLTENQSTYIPLGMPHRLSNPGKAALEIIEIQTGAYLEEDDIVRLSDDYGRISENN